MNIVFSLACVVTRWIFMLCRRLIQSWPQIGGATTVCRVAPHTSPQYFTALLPWNDREGWITIIKYCIVKIAWVSTAWQPDRIFILVFVISKILVLASNCPNRNQTEYQVEVGSVIVYHLAPFYLRKQLKNYHVLVRMSTCHSFQLLISKLQNKLFKGFKIFFIWYWYLEFFLNCQTFRPCSLSCCECLHVSCLPVRPNRETSQKCQKFYKKADWTLRRSARGNWFDYWCL